MMMPKSVRRISVHRKRTISKRQGNSVDAIKVSRKTRNRKALGKVDHLSRLPDELVISILNKVGHLDSLSQCLLVSKHIASLVYRVRTVYVTNITSGANSYKLYKNLWVLPKPVPMVFLEKFRELEYISLDFKHALDFNNAPFAMWKVKFSTNFPRIEKFASLSIGSVSKFKQTINGPHEEEHVEISTIHMNSSLDLVYGHGRYVEWISIVSMLGKSHPSLKRVTVTDIANQGKMVIGYKQLVGNRNCVFDLGQPYCPVMGHVLIPNLHLPLSGYVMKEVSAILNYPTKSGSSDIDELSSWDFEDEEEKVLGEVIKEIYKNHRHGIEKIII